MYLYAPLQILYMEITANPTVLSNISSKALYIIHVSAMRVRNRFDLMLFTMMKVMRWPLLILLLLQSFPLQYMYHFLPSLCLGENRYLRSPIFVIIDLVFLLDVASQWFDLNVLFPHNRDIVFIGYFNDLSILYEI